MTGRVDSVWTKASVRGAAPTPQKSIELVEHQGVVGDQHFGKSGPNRRQVLLVGTDHLQELKLVPGVLREQITVDFPGLQELAPGARLQIGTATIELTGDCAPCLTMAGYIGEEAASFVSRARHKRGMLATVVVSGVVTPGDVVSVHGENTN